MTESDDGVDAPACDLLVIGSGASGLTTAVTAAFLGLQVIVIEKAAVVGGTSAWSGGWLWIPRNPLARASGFCEGIEVVERYLKEEMGDLYDEATIGAFLQYGPQMVSFMEQETSVQFINGAMLPDFHGNLLGSASGGRAICAKPYDGRGLGELISLLRPPLDLVSPFGMGIASGVDMGHFFNTFQRRSSFFHVLRRVSRHLFERARYGRGMHLVNGNALVARLLRSAVDLGVSIRTQTSAIELICSQAAIVGARVTGPDGPLEIRARRGVVLATGGFPHDVERKAQIFDHAPTGREHWSAAPRTNTGDGLRLGEAAGGEVRQDLKAGGGWVPVSLVPQADGGEGHFPHLIDRGKPGAIMVLPNGQRFCNEADSYHDVMLRLFAATGPNVPVAAWILCDHAFIRRFGLGRVRPRPFPLTLWVRNGYLKRGRTLRELAAICGIEGSALEATVKRFNQFARTGVDSDFHRGETPFNRAMGDGGNQPNPNMAPIEAAPYYAVRVVPGSLSTFAGLRTDACGQVLDGDRRPVEGLFAVGNDMSSLAGGTYPAGGFTLGPGMTFGYIVAHRAAGTPLDNNRTPRVA